MEQLFKKIVLMTKTMISFEKNIELQIQYGVLKALGQSVLIRVGKIGGGVGTEVVLDFFFWGVAFGGTRTK